MNNKFNNKNVTIKKQNLNGKIYAYIDNDEMKILTTIYGKEKLIELNGFYKQKPYVRGRCQLKLFLEYLIENKHIQDDYIIEVTSPTSIDGKTENNTFRMYQNIGFNRVQSPMLPGWFPDVLQQKVGILIKRLGEPCKPKPKLSRQLGGRFNNNNKGNIVRKMNKVFT